MRVRPANIGEHEERAFLHYPQSNPDQEQLNNIWLHSRNATSARTGEQRAHAAPLAVPSTLQTTQPQPAATQTFSMFPTSLLMPSTMLELWENSPLTANQCQTAPVKAPRVI